METLRDLKYKISHSFGITTKNDYIIDNLIDGGKIAMKAQLRRINDSELEFVMDDVGMILIKHIVTHYECYLNQEKVFESDSLDSFMKWLKIPWETSGKKIYEVDYIAYSRDEWTHWNGKKIVEAANEEEVKKIIEDLSNWSSDFYAERIEEIK